MDSKNGNCRVSTPYEHPEWNLSHSGSRCFSFQPQWTRTRLSSGLSIVELLPVAVLLCCFFCNKLSLFLFLSIPWLVSEMRFFTSWEPNIIFKIYIFNLKQTFFHCNITILFGYARIVLKWLEWQKGSCDFRVTNMNYCNFLLK